MAAASEAPGELQKEPQLHLKLTHSDGSKGVDRLLERKLSW